MRRFTAAVAGFVLLFVLGCGSTKPKDLIVGKWEATEPDLAKRMKKAIEFKLDGSLVQSVAKGPMGEGSEATPGKYNFTADDLVEIELQHTADKKGSWKETFKLKVEVSKDSLILTDQDGSSVTRFKRKT